MGIAATRKGPTGRLDMPIVRRTSYKTATIATIISYLIEMLHEANQGTTQANWSKFRANMADCLSRDDDFKIPEAMHSVLTKAPHRLCELMQPGSPSSDEAHTSAERIAICVLCACMEKARVLVQDPMYSKQKVWPASAAKAILASFK